MTEHPQAHEISGFVVGDLEEGEFGKVWEHLDECLECVEWLTDVVKLSSAGTISHNSL